MKYTTGTKLIYEYTEDEKTETIHGVVVDNFKFLDDICVQWETGLCASYDEEWLDENTKIDMTS